MPFRPLRWALTPAPVCWFWVYPRPSPLTPFNVQINIQNKKRGKDGGRVQGGRRGWRGKTEAERGWRDGWGEGSLKKSFLCQGAMGNKGRKKVGREAVSAKTPIAFYHLLLPPPPSPHFLSLHVVLVTPAANQLTRDTPACSPLLPYSPVLHSLRAPFFEMKWVY